MDGVSVMTEEVPYDPDRCGEILRIGGTVFICICPRKNHPKGPMTGYVRDGLSHMMVNRNALTS